MKHVKFYFSSKVGGRGSFLESQTVGQMTFQERVIYDRPFDQLPEKLPQLSFSQQNWIKTRFGEAGGEGEYFPPTSAGMFVSNKILCCELRPPVVNIAANQTLIIRHSVVNGSHKHTHSRRFLSAATFKQRQQQ